MKWHEKIREKRIEQGMSQEQLARLSGYSTRSAINNIEKGKRNISVENFKEIAKALHADPLDLLDDDDTASVVSEKSFDYTATDKALERLMEYYKTLSYKERESLVEYAEFLASKEK